MGIDMFEISSSGAFGRVIFTSFNKTNPLASDSGYGEYSVEVLAERKASYEVHSDCTPRSFRSVVWEGRLGDGIIRSLVSLAMYTFSDNPRDIANHIRPIV